MVILQEALLFPFSAATKEHTDYPDFVVRLARVGGVGEVAPGLAICGSRIEACVAASEVPGVTGGMIVKRTALRGRHLYPISCVITCSARETIAEQALP